MNVLLWMRVHWDRAAAGLCVAAGVVALFVGWLGTSGSVYVAEQLPYIVSGGLTGIFFLGVGAVLWLSADLRDEWRELRALRELHTAALLPHEDRLALPEQAADLERPSGVPGSDVADVTDARALRRGARTATPRRRPASRRTAAPTANGDAL